MVNVLKKICNSIWGNKINEEELQIGSFLKIDIESREYKVNSITILNMENKYRGSSTQSIANVGGNKDSAIPNNEENVLLF